MKLATVLTFAVILTGCTAPSGEWQQPSREHLEQAAPIEQRYLPNQSYSREALTSFYTECLDITPYDIPDRVLKMTDREFDRQVAACIAVKTANPRAIEQARRNILKQRAKDDAKLKRSYDKI